MRQADGSFKQQATRVGTMTRQAFILAVLVTDDGEAHTPVQARKK